MRSAVPAIAPSGAIVASTIVRLSQRYWNALPITSKWTSPGCGHARLSAWKRVLVPRYSPSTISGSFGGGLGGGGGGDAQPASAAQIAASKAARFVIMSRSPEIPRRQMRLERRWIERLAGRLLQQLIERQQ